MANYTYTPIQRFTPFRLTETPIELETPPTLESVLSGRRVIPAYSLVLGMCDDQLPLVLDLTETTAGATLIAGDSGFANTTLLHSIITSIFLLNTEYEVNVHLISPQADSLTHFHRQPNFKISYPPDRPECEILLEEMVTLVRSRERSQKQTPYHILFVDSLDILFEQLSPQAKLMLNWLITYGAAHGLYVIATLETEFLKPDLYHTIDCFSSRILGSIEFINDAKYLSGLHHHNLAELTPEFEFIAYINGQAFNLWMLPAENDC